MRETIPVVDLKEYLHLPSIRVEVLEGPDRGRSMRVDKGMLVIGNPKRPEHLEDLADREVENDFVLTDPKVSHRHLIVRRDFSSDTERYVLRDLNSRNGTSMEGIGIREAYLTSNMKVKIGDTVLRFFTDEDEPIEIHSAWEDELEGILGTSDVMKRLFDKIKRVAATPASVLILGETGTGKEMIARAIHNLSSRRDRSFITFDCAIHATSELVHSALFGHVKGSFTGAITDRVGAFEEADQGTLFIDELGDFPLDKQPLLLRALQNQTIQRLGSNHTVRVNTRVIAATHHNLQADIEDKQFREDLYYRLAVVMLKVPPLRERWEDIEPLFHTFLQQIQQEYNAQLPAGVAPYAIEGVTPEALRALQRYQWPGNVRELRNVANVAVNARHRGNIELADLPFLIHGQTSPVETSPSDKTPPTYADAKAQAIQQFEKEFFEPLLRANDFNVSEVSRQVKVTRKVIHRVIHEHQLKK